jgi:hypothetical protein
VLTREATHNDAVGQWGLGGGRPEKQLVVPPEGQGGALYSCGGVRRWSEAALDGEAALADKEEGDWLGASMISYGGQWLKVVAGLAWLRGTRGRCSVASARCLEQRSAVRGRADVRGGAGHAGGSRVGEAKGDLASTMSLLEDKARRWRRTWARPWAVVGREPWARQAV